MAQRLVPQEVNNLTKGLITDTNPLNHVPNSCKDINNVVINNNGVNRRRLGMDYEDDYTEITTSVNGTSSVQFNSHTWENAGGDEDKSLLVVQTGNELKIIDLDSSPISDGVIHTKIFSSPYSTLMSFDNVDSILVVVNGDGNIYTFEYDSDTETVSESNSRILVRDLWGVESVYNSKDLREGNNISIRPTSLSNEHLYNLRNQTFGVERPIGGNETLKDPIKSFRDSYNDVKSEYAFPSNSDSLNTAFYIKPSDSSHPQLERFWPEDLVLNKVGSYETERGYFIIDMLNRGASRIEVESDNRDQNSSLTYSVSSLPEDYTEGGATCVAEYSGRIFYSGFYGETVDGDSYSPRLSSYVAFSRIVENVSDINKCYQKADPTSHIDSDIAPDDGGFLRIEGAYGIKRLVPSGNSLIVLADNGVWRIIGGSDYGFSADNYRVDKISSEGCSSSRSVVFVDGTVLYWGDSGIYSVGINNLGSWQVQSLSKNVIQELYDALPKSSKDSGSGTFDKYDRKVRWVYNSNIDDGDTEELILDIDSGAFYKNTIYSVENNMPKVVSAAFSKPYSTQNRTDAVVVGSDIVQVNSTDVNMTTQVRVNDTRQTVYITVTQVSPTISYTISLYKNTDFRDFFSYDNQGVDAEGYIIINEIATGDWQRRKKSPQFVLHCYRTETSTYLDEDNQIRYDNPSSCMVNFIWDWSSSVNSNRWSNPRQFYRPKRFYIMDSVGEVDSGFETSVSRDIVRGHGKALSIKFSTEEYKDLQILGWSMIWGIGENYGD